MGGRKRKAPFTRRTFQVWMGDLDDTWNETTIIKLWNSLGEAPLSVKLIRDKESGKPMYCFVNFSNAPAMELALGKNGAMIPGTTRKLRLNHASGGFSNGTYDTSRSSPLSSSNPSLSNSTNIKKEFTLFFETPNSEISESAVFDLFNGKYPTSIRQVKITNDYGFIKFNSSATQQIAYKEMNPLVINGVTLSFLTQPPNQTPQYKSTNELFKTIQLPQQQPSLNKYTDPNNTVIEVKGLIGKFTEEEVSNHFVSFGDIISLKLSKNGGCATIIYRFREDAEKAILFLNHSIINGTELVVNWGQLSESQINNNINRNLINRPDIPISYGQNSCKYTRFDKLDADGIQNWIDNTYEDSEPFTNKS